MSYEYPAQGALLIILFLLFFPAMIIWAKWKNKKRR